MRALSLFLLLSVASGGTASESESRVFVGDHLAIVISGVPEDEIQQISGMYEVGETGTINLPHVGEISVSGQTALVAQFVVEQSFKREGIFTAPSIKVAIHSSRCGPPQTVTVTGGVAVPGPVPFKRSQLREG